MSLILEALKKLDREKQAPDRGLLVVGPAEWPTARDSRPGVGAAAAIALALAAIGAAAWFFGGRPSTVARREMPAREVAVREAAPSDVTTRDVAPRDAASRALPPREERATGVIAPIAVPKAAAAPPKAVREPVAREAAQPEPDAALAGDTLEAPEPPPAPAPSARIKEPKLAPGVYQLQAISAQEGQPVAMVNDRLVREGDSFDGARVVRIGTDEVEIEVAGRRRVIKF